MENYYDAHCHVFTNKDTINLRLLIQIILALPNIFEKDSKRKRPTVADIKKKITTLRRILNFIKVGFSDSEDDIYQLMQKVYQQKFNLVPLMFDLEYCFISKRSGEKRMIANEDVAVIQEQLEMVLKQFNENNQKFLDDATNVVNLKHYIDMPEGTTTDLHELQQLSYQLQNELFQLKESKFNKQAILVSLISSFEIQLHDIAQLKAKHPDNVFPFIAIDPRRKGIIERFINEIYAKQIFCGVKLYTPNGYSPSDDDLMKTGGLYDFCCQHNIPITAHNSYGGFASPLQEIEIFGDIYLNQAITPVHNIVGFVKAFNKGWIEDRAQKLNHPDIWDKVVLQKYPNLRLNLAHFGNGSKEWQDKVFAMTAKYPNFYTDLSCWTSKDDLIDFRNNYYKPATDSIFKEKILYGSDYYLDLLFIDSFQEYYNNFLQVFTPDEFTQIAHTNTKKFLFG